MASVSKRPWTHKGVTKTAWVVRYTDGAGARRQKTFDTQKEARAAARGIEAELRAGTHLPEGGAGTVKAVAELFLKQTELKVRSGEFGRYNLRNIRVAIDRHIVPAIGDVFFADLTFRQVEGLFSAMTVAGLSHYTARKHLGVLGRIEAFARRMGATEKSVVLDVAHEMRGAPAPAPRMFTLPEVQALLAAVDARPQDVTPRSASLAGCFVYLAALCGLRFGEINALAVTDIDFARGVIHVRHNLTHFGEIKPPKSAAGRRDVPMPAVVADRLRAWLDVHYIENPDGRVLLTRDGRSMRGGLFHTSYWRPLLRCAGLLKEDDTDRFHFHALRAVYASLMADRVPMTAVARLLGHARVHVTLRHYSFSIAGGGASHGEAVAIAAARTSAGLRAVP